MKPKKGVKHDQQKRRFSLFPTNALYAIVDTLEYGARKYSEGNWRNVENSRQRYYDAAMRHINDWWMGQRNDSESGLHHLAHAACCVVFLLTVDLENPQKELSRASRAANKHRQDQKQSSGRGKAKAVRP